MAGTEDRNMKFLTAIHEVTARADNQLAWLQAAMKNPLFPVELRVKFAEFESVMAIQQHLIKNMAEDQLVIQEQLSQVFAKIDADED